MVEMLKEQERLTSVQAQLSEEDECEEKDGVSVSSSNVKPIGLRYRQPISPLNLFFVIKVYVSLLSWIPRNYALINYD